MVESRRDSYKNKKREKKYVKNGQKPAFEKFLDHQKRFPLYNFQLSLYALIFKIRMKNLKYKGYSNLYKIRECIKNVIFLVQIELS